jgi:hypothetical protein
VITVLFTFAILFSAVIATPVLIGEQVESPANVPSSDKIGVKIMSPSGNVTVPSGPLTIYGISSDTNKTNCGVYVDWNDLKPMQNVTAKGLSGENDYSNWTYTYTEKYHTIAPGINELTSKITCFHPDNITSKYYSINITGLKNNTVSPTLPSSSSGITFGYHSLGYLPQYDGFYHDIFQPIIRDESPGQDSSTNNSPDDNADDSKDDNNNDNNDDSDGTNNDNRKNDDSQSQNDSHSEDVKNDRTSSSEANDDGNEHSNTRSHSGDDENKEQDDNHEKKHNDNNQKKDKGNEKHEGAHSKNLKAHKQSH